MRNKIGEFSSFVASAIFLFDIFYLIEGHDSSRNLYTLAIESIFPAQFKIFTKCWLVINRMTQQYVDFEFVTEYSK